MNEILFELLKVVIMVAVMLITRYAIPWVRERIGADNASPPLQPNLGKYNSQDSSQYRGSDVCHRFPPLLAVPVLDLLQALALLLLDFQHILHVGRQLFRGRSQAGYFPASSVVERR